MSCAFTCLESQASLPVMPVGIGITSNDWHKRRPQAVLWGLLEYEFVHQLSGLYAFLFSRAPANAAISDVCRLSCLTYAAWMSLWKQRLMVTVLRCLHLVRQAVAKPTASLVPALQDSKSQHGQPRKVAETRHILPQTPLLYLQRQEQPGQNRTFCNSSSGTIKATVAVLGIHVQLQRSTRKMGCCHVAWQRCTPA